MDENRFAELFLDVTRWVQQARRLKMAADLFIQPSEFLLMQNLGDRNGFVSQSPEFLERMELQRAYSNAGALLNGLAIENACKARQIREGYIKIENGKPRNLRVDHDLVQMIKNTNYQPNDDELEYLALLAYQIRVLAKYPIAKDLNIQSKFTGRVVGVSAHESQLVNNIVISILKDSDLVGIFKFGHLYDTSKSSP